MISFLKILGLVILALLVIVFIFYGYGIYKFKFQKDTFDLQDQIEKRAQKLIDKQTVTGFSIGIVKNDEVYFCSFGYADLENKIKVDSNTIFEIGSITKVFTTELTQIITNQKILDWQDDITKFYPKDILPKVNDNTKLIHLATHTSGFQSIPEFFENKMLENDCNPYETLSIDDLYIYLKNPIGKTKPDENKINYSNLGSGLLGHILEWRTNKTYEELLQSEICSKLNMTQTSLKVKDPLVFANGYDINRKKTCHWDLPIMYSAGAIKSNISDMVKFVKANLSGSELTNAFKETQKCEFKTTDGKIAKGWHIDTKTDLLTGIGKIVWHNGGTGGFSSYLGIIPEKNIGIVILANQGEVNTDIELLATAILLKMQKVSLKK